MEQKSPQPPNLAVNVFKWPRLFAKLKAYNLGRLTIAVNEVDAYGQGSYS